MFRKLLKYDLAAVFRVWWILSVCFAGISAVGIFSFQVLMYEEDFGVVPAILAGFGVMTYFIALGAYLILSELIIYLRFYKNLFSDEGYLTFSLPVKRSKIYLSKTVSALIWTLASYLVFFASFIAFFLSINGESLSLMIEMIRIVLEAEDPVKLILILVSGILLAAAWLWYSVEMFQFCITIGSVIAKRAKFIAGVGIYAGISTAVETLLAIVTMVFTAVSAVSVPETVWEKSAPVTLLILFGAAVFGTIAAFLHCSTASRIERRLNLA